MLGQSTALTLFALAATVAATLDPAASHSNGTYPVAPTCKPAKISKAIQGAECSHNTRTADQTFAVFIQDHQYDTSQGAPYGTCVAYNCSPGSQMATAKDRWTFFWGKEAGKGEEKGDGMGCIKSPLNGTCGCENSNGSGFVANRSDCK